MSKALYII